MNQGGEGGAPFAETSPRLVVIIGSGETAPTLARVHRSVFDRLGGRGVPACLVDTPYGFQENADDLSARTVEYFRDSVGATLEVATFRSGDVDPLVEATAIARIRASRFVFSGPGSPTYALGEWKRSAIPRAFAEKIATGGALVFASAAALTLGRLTVPVYEIYKVGERPHWLEGLDLLSAAGLPVAVVPHYDNAEGGNHDTRFCYLGERRLAAMERQLPEDVFVLGVDGHTALLLDLDASEATVAGAGGVTVRAAGRSRSWPAGTTLPIAALVETAGELRRGGAEGHDQDGVASAPATGPALAERPAPSLPATVAAIERDFDDALGARDVSAAIGCILGLERSITEWSRDPGRSDDFDHARIVLRSSVVRLGEAAVAGVRDPREIVAPFVETLLEMRGRARRSGDWALADEIRDRLLEAGIEVRDEGETTEWLIGEPRPRAGAGRRR